MMPAISRESLMPLEVYARTRKDFRAKVIAHKKCRTVPLGSSVTLIFEDELTIRYQIQEMLRIEKIFEEDGIEDELSAYSPLVPTGTNWKATMLIEYPEMEERKHMLAQLIGVENHVWVRVEGFDKTYAIADEDLERSNEEKTASVHFLRFELTGEMRAALRAGVGLAMGIDHRNCNVTLAITDPQTKASLVSDLQEH
jgi:Protein of unknown function (DUF3501)